MDRLPLGKYCTVCGEWVLFEDFFLQEGRPMARCKPCVREYQRQWKAKNPDYNKKYYEKHREQIMERCRKRSLEWSRNNPEQSRENARRWNSENKERYRETQRRWRAKNPDRLSVYYSKRHARVRDAEGSFTEAEWVALCERYQWQCLCCHQPRKLTVDHIIPLSRGGTNYIDNIQPLCGSCNFRKSTSCTDYR